METQHGANANHDSTLGRLRRSETKEKAPDRRSRPSTHFLPPFPQLRMLFELLEQQLLPRFSIESIAEALGVVLHETLGFRFLFLLGILVVAAIVVAGRVRRPQLKRGRPGGNSSGIGCAFSGRSYLRIVPQITPSPMWNALLLKILAPKSSFSTKP